MTDIFPFDFTESSKSLPREGFMNGGMCLTANGRPHTTDGFRHHIPPSFPPNRNRMRTRSLSVNESRPLTVNEDRFFSTAILFKDSRGQPAVQPLFSFGESVEEQTATQDDILNFFKCYKCYDLIPTSAKLVVLDTQLVLKKAFFAMVDTGVRACPLWDSVKQEFVGMLTITDFIRILQQNYKGPLIEMETFEEQKLEDWKGITEHRDDLIWVPPDASLFEAVTLLIENKIHRLPIIDPSDGNVLFILNQKPLLRFIFNCVPNLGKSKYLNKSILDVNVGSYQNIQVAKEDTTIIEALNRFVKDRISALPIVDSDGRLISLYSKFDVINLAAERTYEDLEVPLKEATTYKSFKFDGVQNCKGSESVLVVMEKLVRADVNRLVVVDDERKVVGIVTVSDIIYFLVLQREESESRRGSLIGSMKGSLSGSRRDSLSSGSTRGSFFEGKRDRKEEGGRSLPDRDLKASSCSPPRWFAV